MNIGKQVLRPVKPDQRPLLTYEQLNTITTFERLWTHIAFWTKAFIQSTVYGLPDFHEVSNKLYSLPMDFYSIFASFYGTEDSRTFVSLLSDFLMSCMRMTEGMRNGDQKLVDSSTAQWYQAADRLASFLSSINVYWDENQWKNLLYQYTQMKIQEIIAVIHGDYVREIELYQAMEDLTFIMGSYMARGIIEKHQYHYQNQTQDRS